MGSAACPACGAEAPEGAEACPTCGAPTGAADGPVEGSPIAVGDAAGFSEARAWRRFFARSLDVMIEAFVVGVLLTIVLAAVSLASRHDLWVYLQALPYSGTLLSMLVFPLALILDALVYRVAGNTPGKAFLGVVVRNARSEALDFKGYLGRNFRVWMGGYGFGIPLAMLVMTAWQGIRVDKGLATIYDGAPGYRILAKPIGLGRKSAFGVLFVALNGLAFWGAAVSADRPPETEPRQVAETRQAVETWRSTPYAVVSTWTNPVTRKGTPIDPGWQYRTRRKGAGRTLYEFSDISGTALVSVGMERRSDTTLARYVAIYRPAIERSVRLSGAGRFYTDHGNPAWSAGGTLLGDRREAWNVKIIQSGSGFWRIVSLQGDPDFSRGYVGKLEAQLLGTMQ